MNMYNMIATLDLNLKLKVPPPFIKTVFESVAQVAHGLNFSHMNGLIHGNLDLSAIMLKREGDLFVYKLTGFEPVASKPLGYDQKRAQEHKTGPIKSGFTPRYTAQQRRMEEMKYKDIYSLGIAILEMMIGRFSHNRYSITIEDIPSTWSDLNESSTLIQVLLDSLHFDQLKKQRLQSIRNLLIQDMRTFYKIEHFKMQGGVNNREQVMSSNVIDVFNKRAVMHYTHSANEDSELLWTEGKKLVQNAAKAGADLVLNYSLFKWVRGEITDQQLLANLEELQSRYSAQEIRVLLGVIYVGLGLRREGIHQMKKILSEEYSLAELSNPVDMQGMSNKQNAMLNNSRRVSPRVGKASANRINLGSSQSGRIYNTSNVIESPLKRWKDFEKLSEQIQLNNQLIQNSEIPHGHQATITGVHVTNTGKHFALLSEDNQVSIWQNLPFKLVKRLKLTLKKQNFTKFNALGLDNKLDYIVATFENYVCVFFAKDEAKSELEPIKVLDVQNPDQQGIKLGLESLRFFGGPEETSLKLKILKRQLNPQEGTQPASQFNAPFAHIEIEIDESGGKILKMNAIKHQLEEKSIFRYGLNYVNYFTHLREVFEERIRAGDTIVFPEQKFELMIGLRRPNPHQNAPVFYKYHVFNDQILRLIEATGSTLKKQESSSGIVVDQELAGLREEEETKEKTQESKKKRDVEILFDVAVNGSFIISCEKGGDKVRLQTLEVPRQLTEYMKPVYMFAMDRVHALNPAKLLEKKLKIGDQLQKLYKELKHGLSGTSKVKQKEVKKMAVEMYNILQSAFSFSVNLMSNNFQFLVAYRTFMLLYGHRADKEIGQFYRLYTLNSVQFKNSMDKIRYFHSSGDYDKTNVYLSFDNNMHIYNLQRNKIINLAGKVVRGFVVLPDDKSVISAQTYAIRAYNRPHLNPNSKKKPHWQVLREDEIKLKISHIKLASRVILGSKPHKYLPLFVFADGKGWRVFNTLEVMNPTNLAQIGKPLSFQKLGRNDKYHGYDVDFLKKGTICVIGCSNLEMREHFVMIWDFVKENELMLHPVGGDEVIKVKSIQEDRVLAIAQGNKQVSVWHMEEQKTIQLESDLIGTNGCTNLELDKSRAYLFVGIRSSGIEIWNVSSTRIGSHTPPQYVRVFKVSESMTQQFPLASFQLDSSSSMLTLLPVKGREIDFQLIQWKFKHLRDALANGEATFDEEAEQGFRGKTACCQIF